MKRILLALHFLFCSSFLFGQLPTNGLDVTHYNFFISLNDTNNIIHGKAEITTQFLKPEKEVMFDLVNKKNNGKGMVVNSVNKNGVPINYTQEEDHLIIKDSGNPGKENTYLISYEGIPEDGLIISKNMFGSRTFFSDNWPNRAHNWIPCNDHLSDKATVDFFVTAPEHYDVVSNGKKIEETSLPDHLKFTHWKEKIPLPTKIMVIGVAEFATNYVGDVGCIPVSSWVYPEDRDSGFKHYAIAKNILEWYINHIGPYAYEKLANVQSTTIFGGMENAGCIFYFEKSVNSKGLESLMAHEIAHQFFGDNVTGKDWPHLWLSEGFATYMADLYLEDKYGKDSLQNLLRKQRSEVVDFSKNNYKPVVDTTESKNLMKLLNANSYQKGAWVLHMLRRKLGDSIFWKGIRKYYNTYSGKNASTTDLEKVFEKVSNQNLHTFFNQWLFAPGQPSLNIEWHYDKKKKSVSVKIIQTQKNIFEFPLQIEFSNGRKKVAKTINVFDKITLKNISMPFEPSSILVDPNVNLLFDL